MGKGTHEALYAAMRAKATANPEQSHDATRDETIREFEATGPAPEGNPTGAQLQTALNDYMQMLNGMHLGFEAPPMDPDTMVRRYEYSAECRKVMAKIVAEEVQRDRIFANTAEKLFKKDFGDQVKKRVDPLRWMEKLIKIGGSKEDTYHNEEVVALSMLAHSYRAGQKEAGDELFRQTRLKHYTENLKLTEQEAKAKVEDELKNALDRLLQMVENQMKADCPPLNVADQARDAILSETADKLPGGLEGAFRKIINPGSSLAWNIKDITNNFAHFGRAIDDNEYKSRFRPYEVNSTTTHEAVITHVANPFYAILDGPNLTNRQVVGLQPKSSKEDPEFSAAVAYSADIASGFTQSQNELKWKRLPRFALDKSDDRGVRDLDNDISIFSNQRGRTVIIVSGPVTIENGLKIPVRTEVPGQLLNRNFDEKMAELKRKSVAHDRFMHSSGKYRSMKSALNTLAGTRIPDNISKKQAKKLEKRIKDLQKATDAYLKRKEGQFRKRGTNRGKDEYEQARYSFAKGMKSYLEDLAIKAKYIREHTETVEKVVRAEANEAKHMKEGHLVLENPDLTAFQRSVYAEDLTFRQAKEKEEQAKRQREEEEKKARAAKEEAEKQKMAEASDEFDAILTDVEKNIAPEMMNAPKNLVKEMGPALKSATKQAEQAFDQALAGGNKDEISKSGENLLATQAVWEMIKSGYTLDPKIGARLQNIAEGGQVDQLIAGMKKNPKFQQRLAMTDMRSKQAFGLNADTSASISGKEVVKGLIMSSRRKAQNDNIINTGNNENRLSDVSRRSEVKGGPRIGG